MYNGCKPGWNPELKKVFLGENHLSGPIPELSACTRLEKAQTNEHNTKKKRSQTQAPSKKQKANKASTSKAKKGAAQQQVPSSKRLGTFTGRSQPLQLAL